MQDSIGINGTVTTPNAKWTFKIRAAFTETGRGCATCCVSTSCAGLA